MTVYFYEEMDLARGKMRAVAEINKWISDILFHGRTMSMKQVMIAYFPSLRVLP
jgi:hypothetical protein